VSIYWLQKFAHGQLNLLTENQNFYRICLHKEIAHKVCSQQKLLTKIKFAHIKNLLKKLLTEFASYREKLLKTKNLASSDGSTQWLKLSRCANMSTAGANSSLV
jgi:hypothetical protein